MAAEILVVAPFAELATAIRKVIQEQYQDEQLNFRLMEADLGAAEALVKKSPADSCRVIVSRGGTAVRLAKLNILPVVSIQISGMDLAQTILKAEGLTPAKKIGIAGFANMTYSCENLASFMGTPFVEIRLNREEEAEEKIKAAVDAGVDMIVGDAVSVRAAKALGISAYVIDSGKQAIFQALEEALLIARLAQTEDKRPAGEKSREDIHWSDIHGASSAARELKVKAEKLAKLTEPVFICGETGTGKRRLAKAIHTAGQQTVWRELWGGDMADNWQNLPPGTTLYLREADRLSGREQRELMDLLQKRPGDIRLLASAVHKLPRPAEKNELLPEFYYALQAFSLDLTPLRERKEDIPLLAAALWEELGAAPPLSAEVLALLEKEDWPGNLWQLKAFLRRLQFSLAAADEEVSVEKVGEALKGEDMSLVESKPAPLFGETNSGSDSLREVEDETMQRVLWEEGNNYTKAAKRLGIHRTTLWRKLKRGEAAHEEERK